MANHLALTTREPVDRSYLTIDGAKYEVANGDDLGIAAQAKLMRLATNCEAFIKGDAASMTDEQITQLETDVRWAAGELLPDCPADVLAKLDDAQRMQVVGAFGLAASERRAAEAKPNPAKSSPTRVPRSKSATAAIPSGG